MAATLLPPLPNWTVARPSGPRIRRQLQPPRCLSSGPKTYCVRDALNYVDGASGLPAPVFLSGDPFLDASGKAWSVRAPNTHTKSMRRTQVALRRNAATFGASTGSLAQCSRRFMSGNEGVCNMLVVGAGRTVLAVRFLPAIASSAPGDRTH